MLKTQLKSTAAVLSLIAAGALTAAPTLAANYTVDPAHSFIQFSTVHLGYSKLPGQFNKFSGKLEYDPEKGPEAQKINITIDTTSIDTNHADRDKHLRSDDFFKTGSMTEATFESTKFEGDASGGTVTGNLTLLGVTKEISFPIKKIGEGPDPWGGYRVGFEGDYTLTRSDFGMDFELGPAAKEVNVKLMIEAIKDK